MIVYTYHMMERKQPYQDTRDVHTSLLEWMHGTKTLTIPNLDPASTAPDWLPSFLRLAIQTEIIHYVMEGYEKEGLAFYSISPEFIGPVITPCQNSDPIYAQYRHMSFLYERAQQRGYTECTRDIIRGYFCSNQDINGGRHKVNANVALDILPTTPAIGTDYPKAFGTAKSIILAQYLKTPNQRYPHDAICIVSGGDGSIHHPTALSTFNMAKRSVELNEPLPLMFVISDNGIAISERSHAPADQLLSHWGLRVFKADAKNVLSVYQQAQACQTYIRTHRTPAILVIKTYRLYGHSANRRNENFQEDELQALHQHPPLLYLMQLGEELGVWQRDDCLSQYNKILDQTFTLAETLQTEQHLSSKHAILTPLKRQASDQRKLSIHAPASPLTLRRVINSVLEQTLNQCPDALFYGQDISPGHYGIGMGLKKRFPKQVFGYPIDEISLVGSGNGLIWNGLFPIIEISYKAYFTEGGWQQVYEHMLQRFLCDTTPPAGMIIRMPALGLVKGGPTHTENSFPERLIPQIKTFCIGPPLSALLCYRTALTLATEQHQCVIINEATHHYFLSKDDYPPGCEALFIDHPEIQMAFGDFIAYHHTPGQDLQVLSQQALLRQPPDDDYRIITYGNGVKMALEAAFKAGGNFSVIEYPALQITEALLSAIHPTRPTILVDECRPTACPGLALFHQAIQRSNQVSLLTSADTFNPSGPAQQHAYLQPNTLHQHIQSLYKAS